MVTTNTAVKYVHFHAKAYTCMLKLVHIKMQFPIFNLLSTFALCFTTFIRTNLSSYVVLSCDTLSQYVKRELTHYTVCFSIEEEVKQLGMKYCNMFNSFMAKFFNVLYSASEKPFYQITHMICLLETIYKIIPYRLGKPKSFLD